MNDIQRLISFLFFIFVIIMCFNLYSWYTHPLTITITDQVHIIRSVS
jgi:hypothetical protein